MAWRSIRWLAAAPLMVACSSAGPSAPVPAPPPGSSGAPLAANGANEPCVCPPDESFVSPSPAPQTEPVLAGQMTEEAAQAKRLYDGERWADARMLLDRIVRGDTGDDVGNRQIAEYHSAIASYRLEEHERALEQLAAISQNPNHLKFDDTLLWLVKLTQVSELCDAASKEVHRYSRERVEQVCEKVSNGAHH